MLSVIKVLPEISALTIHLSNIVTSLVFFTSMKDGLIAELVRNDKTGNDQKFALTMKYFTFEMNGIPNNSIVELSNLLGKKIVPQIINFSKSSLKLKLPAGMYFLSICDERGKLIAKKMIVN